MAESLPTYAEAAFADRSITLNAAGRMTSARVPYIVYGAATEEAAAETCLTAAGQTYDALWLSSVEVTERLNATTFRVEAIYRPDEARDRDASTPSGETTDDTKGNADPVVSFDTTGGSAHINLSFGTTRYPDSATDYGGAIEVDADGNVQGCDIVMPTMTYTETHYFKPAKMTDDYRLALYACTGKINKENFRGFNAGEVLFTGASARRTGTGTDDLWEVTFNFSISRDHSINYGGEIGTVTKPGWAYAWAKFADAVADGKRRKTPVAVYVEKVYESVDFSTLKIEGLSVED